jgi:hypothetical protein
MGGDSLLTNLSEDSQKRSAHGAMNAVASRRNVAKSLEYIAEFVAANPAEAPVDFVRELARCWKERGGYLAGKPRHSDRYLDELLKIRGTPIRSLTPKIGGRTNLRAADAHVLVPLFLSHWKYKGDPNSGEIRDPTSDLYEPMLPDAEIGDVSAYIAERITASESETAPAMAPLLPGESSFELIVKEFRESAGLITAATGRPLLVESDATALIGFRDLMDSLWAVERSDNQPRILIWTVDLGRRVFEDPEARQRFRYVQSLIERFKALVQFKESVTEARWNWLQSRVVIVVHDTVGHETLPGRPEVRRLPAFDPHHVLFSAIPPKLGGSPEFIALYGHQPAEANYSVFIRTTDQFQGRMTRSDKRAVAGQSYALRYFGHALLRSGDKNEMELRGLQLEPPGWSYVEAQGNVFIAANQVLGLPALPAELFFDSMKIDPVHAIAKLQHHRFRLLRLDEFIND